MAGSEDNYRLFIGGYSGNAGDAMILNQGIESANGTQFSTFDMDNDNSVTNCAEYYRTGWWMNQCMKANLNGEWKSRSYMKGVMWYPLTGNDNSVDLTEMKVRTHPNRNIDLGQLNTNPISLRGKINTFFKIEN